MIVNDIWILDYIYSYHIYYIRKKNYTFLVSDVLIHIENDQPRRIEIIQYFKIQMFDEIQSILTHVRFKFDWNQCMI